MQDRKGGKEPDEVQDGRIHVCPPSVSHSSESDRSSVTNSHTHRKRNHIHHPPPRIAKVRHPVPVRPLGAGRSRRARNDHQGLIKLRARTSALTLSRPSSALPSVYISKVQCPLQDPVPLIDLPTAFRPKPSIAHDRSSSGINLRSMSRGTAVLPQSAPPHSPTTPRTRVPDPNTTAQSPRTPTNRLPPHVPYTPAAPSVECEFLRNLTSRSKLLSYPGHPRFRPLFHASYRFAINPCPSHPHPQAQLPELTWPGSAVGFGEEMRQPNETQPI